MMDLKQCEEFICNLLSVRCSSVLKKSAVELKTTPKTTSNAHSKKSNQLKQKYVEKISQFESKRKGKGGVQKKKLEKSAKTVSRNKLTTGNQKKPIPQVGMCESTVLPSTTLINTKKKNIHKLTKTLKDISKHEANIAKLKAEVGVQPAVEAHASKQMELAIARAEGQKPKDDPTRIKNAIKRKQNQKQQSRKKWAAREQSKQAEKQKKYEKRKANVQARKDQRKNLKQKKLQKKRGLTIDSASVKDKNK